MKRSLDFMKSRVVMLIISAIVAVGGIAGTVAQGGFNLGIDFEAGLSLTVDISGAGDVSVGEVRDALASYQAAQIQRLGSPEDDQFIIRVRDDGSLDSFEQVVTADLLDALRSGFAGGQVEELETLYVGPRFSRDLTSQAVTLTVFALLLILGYLWFRFRLGYALASISALVHDVVIILGVIGTFQLEVSTASIAAVLTIIGYSLNDTIVIFDRIRENEVLLRENEFRSIINTSITQSLGRTLITSITTLLAVTAIFIFSTGQIQLFALKLMVGVAVGTYSSIFVASPVLLVWQRRARDRQRRRDAERYRKGSVAKSDESSAAAVSGQAAVRADAEAVKREIARKRSSRKGRRNG